MEARDVAAAPAGTSGVGGRPLLDGVDLDLGEGEALIVLGASGSGKTTLLRLLNRFDDPVRGTIRYRGRPLHSYDPRELRRRVALVLQTPVLFEGTVEANLSLRPRGVPNPGREHLERSMQDVGLAPGFLERPAQSLSLGEKQRVALARALVAEPDVLLLDEPTSALDPSSTAMVAELLLALQRTRGVSLVLVTHQAELVRRFPARVALLAGGRLTDAAPDTVARFLDGE